MTVADDAVLKTHHLYDRSHYLIDFPFFCGMSAIHDDLIKWPFTILNVDRE